ncbi:STAS/SEC14 domain-containing protein [Virgibacillus sp. W0181]|uniref:STAS/SEC14 domain-containing protein n=1 Tax=Virgibacillus sp. W0181 TaxID=3391581 RepID=UPI003F47F6BC
MIDIISADHSPVIEITINGKITKSDMDKFEELLSKKVTEQERINLLLIAENWSGITPKGFLEDMKMTKHLNSIKKAALVSDKTWIKAGAKLENLFPGIQVDYFTPDNKSAAIDWLKS